ncbi:MAG: glucosamine--fructose-6-phosphate aminotransferase (isomerizing) [Flavobacterium sp.]|jgi:glucosamine--fructose-6-phosphate aminotransferase (isomerizing)
MCGIVAAATRRNVSGILLEGLQRLEYRGYDSAGMALLTQHTGLQRSRRVGKVKALRDADHDAPIFGQIGIAHTRWATHGKPTEKNAHPHVSNFENAKNSVDQVAIVHNGIIENHEVLRLDLRKAGYVFESETDTEVIAHLVHQQVNIEGNLLRGLESALRKLEGAYAVAAIHEAYPDRIVAARAGSPLVVGLGIGENFVASDPQALRPVTDRFIYLEEGELVEISADKISIFGTNKHSVESRTVVLDNIQHSNDKGNYRHFMMKEIHDQPDAIRATLEGRVSASHVLAEVFGVGAAEIFKKTKAVHIVACGSSFYTGLVAKYWFEELAGIPCHVEIASEYRYRKVATVEGTLLVTISQSGETADTLAALRFSKNQRRVSEKKAEEKPESHYLASLCLCNVPSSSLVRESDLSLLIKAGPEICVASTKAFTTQLADLLLLVIAIGKHKGLSEEKESELVSALHTIPDLMATALLQDKAIEKLAEQFADKQHALFLGRGSHYPVAMEGALKLKEISYIHAEGYPAGELKHGPLALVDDDMPVVAVAPSDDLLGKLKSNLQEVQARGGQLIIFGDEKRFQNESDVITIPSCHPSISPIIYTIPMQLLAYHVALLKGTDVDQPRNLAKSVTVE